MSQNVEDVYPLTPLQEGMLFHSLEAPGSGVYIERLSCDLSGELDSAVFRQSWEAALARHPALRTAFLWQGLDQPMQVVRHAVRLPWREEDWRGLPEGEREERLDALREEDLRRGFDVARAPLLRITLFRLEERTWRLVWTHHHLLLDGWARVHVLGDVLSLYVTARRGLAVKLPPVRPFRDYVAWLMGPGKQDLQGAEAFWRSSLAGFTSPTPLGFLAAARAGGEQEDTDLALAVGTTAALQERARRERITLNTLVQGAWALLLARLSGEEDVVYGNVVSGRPASLPGAEAMVGAFINTLPVRARLRPAEPAGDWLRRLQEELAAQRRYEHTPLLQVQAWSEVPRGTPLFETLMVFENHPAGGTGEDFRELEIGDPRYDSRAHYPLSLVAFPGERLRLQLKHERARLDVAAAARLLGRLETLLAGLASDADRPLSGLPYLPEAEVREALARSAPAGNRRPPLPGSLTLHGLVADRAAAAPDAVAVEHNGDLLTYGELERRASRLARRLRERGAGPGTIVGLEVERSPGMVVGMLAILKAGAAYLPLDPSHPAERRRALLADAGATLLLTRELLEKDGEDVPGPLPVVSADALAYVIYTSGSTGAPKGVAVSHRAVLHLLVDTDYVRLEPDDVVAQVATPAFDAATFEVWGPLLAGARLSIFSRYESLHPPDFAAGLRERGVTTLFLTTALFNAVAREVPEAFAGLRYLLFGGEAVDPGAVRAVLAAGPPRRLLHVYGPTEATTFSTWHLVREVPGETVPIGGPITGTRALVLDLWGGLAPGGVAGELCVGGDGLARGYLGRPDLTAERFIPDPLETGRRLYRTGDLVRWGAGGALEFLGRTDHQVKVRGFRVEPGEVEAVLRGLPGVSDALVAALPDPLGGRRLVAWWVRRPRPSGIPAATAEELRAALRSRLPEPMVPSAFVEVDELPLNASGKVDRSRLPAPEKAGLPEAPADAPLTPVQELLAGIVAALLAREGVDLRDSFLSLGGHSLRATQVVSRVREAFGVDLPLAAVFEEPSILDLAGRIEALLRADAGAGPPPLRPVPRDGELPLSFAQERLWILDQLEPGTAAYNIPLSARLTGDLHVPALRAALSEIVRRHEALRTGFPSIAGRPAQAVEPFRRLDLPVVEVGGLAEALRVAREEAGRPFVLDRPPLIRALLLRVGSDREHVLLVNLHHIVADGWSLGVMLRELSALYPAGLASRPSPLPGLPVQYADFAVWQRRWLQGEALERELAFWRGALDGVPELDLPTDRPRRAVTSFEGGLRAATLGPELAAAVAGLCQAAKATPFMALLAAWELLLARYAGQEDFAVGVPVANRDRVETEGLIGFFVNTLVLRARLDAAVSGRDLLARVRETALGVFAHRDMPFQKLVEELQPHRDQQLSPFFQAFFALQNAPMPPLEMPGLTLSPFPMDTGTAKFELSLSLVEDGEGYLATLEHSRDLFDGTTAERLLGHFAALLGALAGAPERPVSELPLLFAAESQQLLVDWNDTGRPGAAGALVHRVFEERAAETPEAAALLRSDLRITYGELNGQANRLARRLRRLGIGPEEVVGVFLDSSPELILAYLAILKAGGAYLPLVPTDPRERLEFMLGETRARVVLTRAELRDRLAGVGATVLAVDEPVEEEAADLPPLLERGDALAYVMYTSGSTGRPKGVAVDHEGIVRLVRDCGFADLGPDQTLLQITAISFDVSTFEIWGALLNGGGLAFLPGPGLALEEIGAAIARHGITTIWLSSGLFAVMVDRHLDDLRPLRQLVAGGDVVPLPQARRVLEEIPGCRLIDGYGPTENTTFTACHTVTRADVERPSIPIGRPLNSTTVYVLDAGLRPVPVGVHGALHTGGLGLARGYFGRPDLTAEVFVPHPFAERPGERLYNTGDLARWLPDGTLEFLGRRDTQVKVRGFRIEPGEVEAALAAHPAVADAVVVPREVRPGDRRLIAYLVPATAPTDSGGREPSAADLQAFLRRGLPDYMIPSVFVILDALPLNRSGKVDRRALPASEAVGGGASQASYVPPRNELEERIAGIWREVLGVERVGVHDSFFGLGGHSLLLLQVMSRLRQALGRDLPKGLMFEHPTVASLAAELGAPAAPAAFPAPALERSQDRAAARRESLRQRQRPGARRGGEDA